MAVFDSSNLSSSEADCTTKITAIAGGITEAARRVSYSDDPQAIADAQAWDSWMDDRDTKLDAELLVWQL